MRLPLGAATPTTPQIIWQHLTPSDGILHMRGYANEANICKQIAKLEKFADLLSDCRVVIAGRY